MIKIVRIKEPNKPEYFCPTLYCDYCEKPMTTFGMYFYVEEDTENGFDIAFNNQVFIACKGDCEILLYKKLTGTHYRDLDSKYSQGWLEIVDLPFHLLANLGFDDKKKMQKELDRFSESHGE